MFGVLGRPTPLTLCGCYIWNQGSLPSFPRRYLPQAKLDSHTTILGTTSRTILKQTFINNTNDTLQQVRYVFPLYDGVSISDFQCTIGERVIKGTVKERTEAKAEYDKAISQGQTAGLLEQNQDAADVFTTSIGNVAKGETIVVEITYLGELKNDAETDGLRFTIPTAIAPRYGGTMGTFGSTLPSSAACGISITVDVKLEQGTAIRGIQSASHPIAVTMGRLSSDANYDDIFENNQASSTLALGSTELDKDFVVIISAKDQDTPRALLETHPTIPNQKALMTTLVPKFNLPAGRPEIIFVVDRSGSMGGKMHLVVEAMKVFLKSLPVGVKFNIYSFGSQFTSLFDRSKTYDEQSLQIAMSHISNGTFQANYGGTEMLQPVEDILEKRYKDLALEVMLLTDGEIWNQDDLFKIVNKASTENSRFFTLGIGHGASSSLVEGIARAGRGFSQWVNDGERIDKKLVRMLKGALTPHIDYRLELVYAKEEYSDDDFEIIESFDKSMKLVTDKVIAETTPKKKISLFSKNKSPSPEPKAGRYDHLPELSPPNVLQIPHQIPELYTHSRTSVYILLNPEVSSRRLTAVWLKGSSEHGDLELEIPVQEVGQGDTIHKLAAKKAMQDLEEGRGWLNEAKSTDGTSLKSQHEGKWDIMVEREAVRLGTTFQVAGKSCSFVAIDETENPKPIDDPTSVLQDYQMGLMILQQQNRGRKMMAPQVQARMAPQAPMAMSRSAKKKESSKAPAPGGGLFGSSSSNFTPASTIGGGLFGSSSSNFAPTITTGGGLFGSSSSNMAPAPSGGLFATSSSNFAPTTTTGAGLFGNATAFRDRDRMPSPNMGPVASVPAFSMSAFGSAQPPPPPGPQSLFGAAQPTNYSDQVWGSAASTTLSQASFQMSDCGTGAAEDSGKVLANFDFDSFLAPGPDMEMMDASAEDTQGTTAEMTPKDTVELMRKLIDLQSFSGSWKVDEKLLSIISHGLSNKKVLTKTSDIPEVVESKKVFESRRITDEVAATIFAIAWLESRAQDEKDVWDMVVVKARQWLTDTLKDGQAVNRVIEAVKAEY